MNTRLQVGVPVQIKEIAENNEIEIKLRGATLIERKYFKPTQHISESPVAMADH